MEEVCSVVKKGIKTDKFYQIMKKNHECQDENINNKSIFDTQRNGNERSWTDKKIEFLYNKNKEYKAQRTTRYIKN